MKSAVDHSVGRRNKPVDWLQALQPLFGKYGGKRHPLASRNTYQLVVTVILSARAADIRINELAPAFFVTYPSIKALAAAEPEDLHPMLSSVPGFVKKSRWLVSLARTVGDDGNIPKTLEGLIALPGIGRKSANVIISGSGGPMEGVIVDLHVLRVAPRLGIARGSDPLEIEQQLMKKLPQENWRELGLSLTHLGREICRPTDPLCRECPVSAACGYYRKQNVRSARLEES